MKKTICIISAFILIFLSVFASGCGRNTNPESEYTQSSSDAPQTDSTSDVGQKAEQTFQIELTSEETTEAQTETESETTAAETTAPETLPTEPAPYTPYVPSGNGNAPLALMYHLILDTPFTSLENLFVRPSELRGHIEALQEAGYTFIFADEYTASDEKTVIMSFDDGYIDNYTEMFPIIKEYKVKVTVFMVTGYIGGDGYLSEEMIREMSSSGLVSFQSHTHNHSALTGLSADSLRYEFSESNRILENITGRKVRAICYPSGGYNDLVLSVAEEYYDFGYTTVSRNSTAGYPMISLPRLRVNRGLSKASFANMIP